LDEACDVANKIEPNLLVKGGRQSNNTMSYKNSRTLMRDAGNKEFIHSLSGNVGLSNKFTLKLTQKSKDTLGSYELDTQEGIDHFIVDYKQQLLRKAVEDRARVAARVAAKPKKDKKGKKNRKPKK
jgi:hypothetical protein|tara:strand:+ start:338 stop:715 length:378 start_codon:yes stop_codon:yes gene_type:complete